MSEQDELNGLLGQAAEAGDLEALKQALESGADARDQDSSALQWASIRGHAECVTALIGFSEPRAADSHALRLAARGGHVECVRLLMPVSDPKALESQALFDAAAGGHAECVRLLIPTSDPLAKESDALAEAAERGHAKCVGLLLPVSEKRERAAAKARANGHMDVAGVIEAFIEARALLSGLEQAELRPVVKRAL